MALDLIKTNTTAPIGPRNDVSGSSASSADAAADPQAALDFRGALDKAKLSSQSPGISNGTTEAARGVAKAPPGLASLVPSLVPSLVKPLNVSPAAEAPALKFSAHAVERMRSRGIMFGPEMMKNVELAVQKASAKGSKDTLVIAGDAALIVSVKNNTVVTVMDKQSMRENVFTNIDSTVVV